MRTAYCAPGNAEECGGSMPPGAAAARGRARMFVESPVRLSVNQRHCMTFLCTPQEHKELILGYLVTTRRIRSPADILRYESAEQGTEIHVQIRPEPDDAAYFQDSRLTFAPDGTLQLPSGTSGRPLCAPVFPIQTLEHAAREMIQRAILYQRSGGVHSAAVGDGSTLLSCEDVSRNNALDKAIGSAVLRRMTLGSAFLILTGRISFEMLLKAAAANITLVASLNVPSSLAVEAAEKFGVTLIGSLLQEEQHRYTRPRQLPPSGG